MLDMSKPVQIRVAIAGLGAIGLSVAQALAQGIEGFVLVAVSAKNRAAAKQRLSDLSISAPVLSVEDLESQADLLIESAPAHLLPDLARAFLSKGKSIVVLSVSALADHLDLIDLARATGAQIFVPSGALLGLDAVAAAAQGTIHSVQLVTRKPPAGFGLSNITVPKCNFAGSAREAAQKFPANMNVAVALGLAGIGLDATGVEIWADPAVSRNVHAVTVHSDCATFSMSIENVPSENPKTSRITALSVVALLRKMRAPLRIGS
jgi:aspartate dehydrogenase